MFPDKLHVSSFQDRFPLCLDRGIVSPLQLHWVKGVCMFMCNLPPVLTRDFFYVPLQLHGGRTDTKQESVHKVNSGEENSPDSSAGIQTRNLSIMSLALLPTSYSKLNMSKTLEVRQKGNVVTEVPVHIASLRSLKISRGLGSHQTSCDT